MLLLRNPNINFNINLDSSFASNQTFNIFNLKIFYALFLTSNLLYINLNITSYISALALSRKEVLRVLRNQG